mmetsp:Transcript_17025/g.25771  ORF Transcript_17025/g.25771 Transcript_17025/m.25771 type:complete len:323 (-) Transcript_17025:171-1139(-)
MPPYQRTRNAVPNPSKSSCRLDHYRFALCLAYDGTTYKGFQSQNHGNTIQDVLEARLQSMLKRDVRVLGWGRTDAGVHANGAVCTVDLSQDEVLRFSGKQRDTTGTDDEELSVIDSCLERVAKLLCTTFQNIRRDGSIVARSCRLVPRNFDARFSCLWKRYIYTIACGKKSPLLSRYTWQMETMLDYPKIQTVVSMLNGRHNFGWLSKVLPGDALDPIRTLTLEVKKILSHDSLPLFPPSDSNIVFFIQVTAVSDFFLYRMVRRIVGLLVAVGKGHVDPSLVASCLKDHDDDKFSGVVPKVMVNAAPPNGLSLDHIQYDISI